MCFQFLLKLFIAPKDSVLPLLNFKGLSLHGFKKCLQDREISLNKIDVQNFPQKCLFTLKMIRIFIHVNLEVLLANFLQLQYKSQHEWKNSQYLPNILY